MASYYVWSGATGAGTGANWANAYTTLSLAFSGKAGGDTFYVAHDHAQTIASALGLTPPISTAGNPVKIICVDRAGSVPPVSADRRATAQITTTGALSNLNTEGFCHYDGVIFNCGSGASGAVLNVNQTSGATQRFDNCSFRINTTITTASINLGNTTFSGLGIELNNTTVFFAAIAQTVFVGATVRWRNTLSALLGTVPTILFSLSTIRGPSLEAIGVDFSAAGPGKTLVGASSASQGAVFRFIDCKLDAAVTKSVVPTVAGASEVDFVRSGATGINYTVHRHRVGGLLTEETSIIRTGGASDGTTPIAWKIVTTANCSYSMPFECPPIAIWNDTVGSPITATVEGIASALPTDQECWLDVEYLGDASSPQGSFINDGKADLLTTAANQTASSATWGGSTTAFKLAVTFTPQQKGWVYARVKCAKASSTFYIDPLVTLT